MCDNEGLAREGLASFPVGVGDYVELRSGTFGKVAGVHLPHNLFTLTYLWGGLVLGETRTFTQQFTIQSYRRHATVNEITALKLMGLV